ncbi:MAG: substrate-binding domain-containing protein [Microbacterium sp.]|uniref:sugar ABC transporter substrate-binding protein n=1 Tax=Microbacterium sp. TaxID=51671 RepID=UPI0039E43C99
MKSTFKGIAALAVGSVLAVAALAGCSGNSSSGSSGDAIKVGLLLPESKTARYESFDRPIFTDAIEALGNYEVVYSNADQDSSKQQQQAESAIAAGVKVLVLDPVDADAAASIVEEAAAANIPVISYDRLISSDQISYYLSFDNEKVGELQAQTLLDGLEAEGTTSGGLIMINGSPTDPNAASFKEGAHSVLDDSGFTILAEYDTPDWSADNAQSWMTSQLAQYNGQFVGVYAANDGTAGGAIAAMQAANVSPWPLVTGQDAELAGIQRIVSGDQYMTIYKSIKDEATKAAEIAAQLASGETVEGDTTVDGIPSTLLTPVAVTIDNIVDTVVADGFWSVSDICTSDYAAACTAAGIQ